MNPRLPHLGAPEGFGYLGGAPIRVTEPPEVRVSSPEQIGSHFSSLPEPMPLPDLVVATQGPVNKETVGRLLKAANGQESGWVGVSATDAIQRLQKLGMPLHAEDQPRPWWEAKIAEHEMTPNALSLLGY